MSKQIGILGGTPMSNAGLLLAAMASLGASSGLPDLDNTVRRVLGKMKEPRPTGNPTPASIARRERRNKTRLANAIRDGHSEIGISRRFVK